MRTLLIILIILCFTKFSNAQTIEKFSIDSGGDSAIAGGIEVLYTIGEVNVQELSAGTIQVSEGFINAPFRVLIDPKVFLQGPLLNPSTPNIMNDILREDAKLPTTSPYADGATVNGAVFSVTGNDAIVDWIWLELRAANDNTKLINARSALVQRDGDVVDFDGISGVIMQAAPTSYYVVVKHRNHLGAMSSATIGLSDGATTVVDFTDSAFTTFGSFARTQLGNGSMALWAGDTNSSGQIKFSGSGNSTNVIKDFVLADPANGFNSVTFASSGYLDIDIDLNGFGKFSGSGNDSNIIKDNVLAHPANGFGSVTYTISSTVPPNN